MAGAKTPGQEQLDMLTAHGTWRRPGQLDRVREGERGGRLERRAGADHADLTIGYRDGFHRVRRG